MKKKISTTEPTRLDKVENPSWRPRKHKYDCFRIGASNVFAGSNDFVKDYHHPKLTKKQLRIIINEYFKRASIDIIRKNEIFNWPQLGKIFIGKYRGNISNPYALLNTDGYAFRFYLQKHTTKGTLRHYDFMPCKSVNLTNKPDYGLSGLRRWIHESIHNPKLKYDAIFMGS